jgi:hypothetical protein
MGATQSSSRISHETVLKSTKDTRVLVDEIFRFMQRELNIRDFYKLSVPSECDKYIVVMTDFLDALFSRLQLVPVKNKAGFLYFRKIDDLRKDEKIKAERRAGCLLLSCFYIRILQIYGALALTVADEAQQFTQLLEGQNRAPYTSRLAIGFQPGNFIGGAGDENVVIVPNALAPPGQGVGPAAAPYGYYPGYPQPYPFQPARGSVSGQKFKYQKEPLSALNELGPKYRGQDSNKIVFDNVNKLFLKSVETELGIFTNPTPQGAKAKAFLKIPYDTPGNFFQNTESTISLDLEPTESSIKNGRLTVHIVSTDVRSMDVPKEIIMNIRIRGYTSTMNSAEVSRLIEEEKRDEEKDDESADKESKRASNGGLIKIKISNITIPNSPISNYKPLRLGNERSIYKDPTTNSYKVANFLDGSFTNISVKRYIELIIYFILIDPKIVSVLYPGKISLKKEEVIYREKEARKELEISELLNVLQKPRKPRPYCISRALQLLTTNPTDKTSYSNICIRDFSGFGIEQALYEKSIPLRGKEFGSVIGIQTLENLFADTFNFMPNEGLTFVKSKNSFEVYKNFLLNMIRLFAGTQPQKETDLKKLVEQRSERLCGQYGIDSTMRLNQEQIKKLPPAVQASVSRLFNTQIKHTAKVGQLLGRLFFRKKLPSGEFGIFLHPDLLNKGFIRLQEINRDAYNLLTDYYSVCEQTYADGEAAMAEYLKPQGAVVAKVSEKAAAAVQER